MNQNPKSECCGAATEWRGPETGTQTLYCKACGKAAEFEKTPDGFEPPHPDIRNVAPERICCDECWNSKFALRGKNKEKFKCGLVCPCHLDTAKECLDTAPTAPETPIGTKGNSENTYSQTPEPIGNSPAAAAERVKNVI